jgi:hypothetical protein
MPKLDFTADEIKAYAAGRRAHPFKEKCNSTAKQLRTHALGEYPGELIECRRPNEPAEVMDYRKKIWSAKTKPYFGKIETTLQKIRRSTDWSIRYDLTEFTRVPEGEDLETYCEKKFPKFGSVTNWAFAKLLRDYLIDPNGVVVIMPVVMPQQETEYYRPEPFIFDSLLVIDYEQDDFAFIKDTVGCIYLANGKPQKGETYWGVTTQDIIRYDQIDGRKTFAETDRITHGFGELPIVSMGGVIVETCGPWVFRESRIAGIVPEFNEALREYSDLQASKVIHMYPERWEYTNSECTTCKGTGQRNEIINEVSCQVECKTCMGRGYTVAGPYSKIVVKPTHVIDGASPVPTPPAGYVEKDVEIIKVQETSVQDHITAGLAAINFEFLASTPLSQSGVAKEVDKDEANSTAHAIAEDIVAIMDGVYYFVAKWRYGLLYDDEAIREMVPKVAVPEKFDIFTSTMYQEQFKAAKESKMNPAILNTLEREYANKAFNNDPEVADRVSLVLSLDPLANITEDDKMSRLSNNGITQENYIISSNINSFVERAIEEDAGFTSKTITEQKEVIRKYAQEQEAASVASVLPEEPIEDVIADDV